MKKSKKADEKNSLEQLLLKGKSSFEANKTKAYQYILLVVLLVLIVMACRMKLFGGTSKMDAADAAYYAATQPAFSGTGVADGAMLTQAADAYKSSAIGSILSADAGDAYLQAGQADVEARKNYSRGVKPAEGEAQKPADPSVNFNAAFEAYEKAAASVDANIQARAYYGAGVAQESLASVAADDAAVEAALGKAKECYQKVAEVAAESPYAPIATERLASLERGLTVDYYKSSAQQFVNLPEPSAESILSDKGDELNVGEALNVGGFDTNDDATDATEAAPAEEDATPATEEEASAPAAEDAAPVEEAAPAEAE